MTRGRVPWNAGSMANTPQIEKARRFRELHRVGRILTLANAWDAASARVFAEAGFPAIGTTLSLIHI